MFCACPCKLNRFKECLESPWYFWYALNLPVTEQKLVWRFWLSFRFFFLYNSVIADFTAGAWFWFFVNVFNILFLISYFLFNLLFTISILIRRISTFIFIYLFLRRRYQQFQLMQPSLQAYDLLPFLVTLVNGGTRATLFYIYKVC